MEKENKKQTDQQDIIIRKCRPGDRDALRRLCCDTAYFGNPCEAFFPDREFLADLIMDYYICCEPEHTWVAEDQGEVTGYLCAGLDDSGYDRKLTFQLAPVSLLKALARGKIWDRKTARLIKYNIRSFLSGETSLEKIDRRKFSAHIHMNMKKGCRGKGSGTKLVTAMLEELKSKTSGIRFRALRREPHFLFFEKYGFTKFDCRRAKIWEKWLGKSPLYFMEYGKIFHEGE